MDKYEAEYIMHNAQNMMGLFIRTAIERGSGAVGNSIWRLHHDKAGSVVIATAVSLFAIAAVVGVAVDYSRAISMKDNLQVAVDSAALGAVKDGATISPSLLDSTVVNYFTANFAGPGAINVQVTDKYDSKTAELTANASAVVKTAFLGIIGINQINIGATAIAQATSGGPCVIALAGTGKETFKISGAGTVNIPNCGVYVNSSDATALNQIGAGYLKSAWTAVVGGYALAGHFSPIPKKGQPVITDPLAGVVEPTIPASCTYNNYTFSVATTISGGAVFCGKTTFNASITFGPGIHYFKGAQIATGNNVQITSNQAMLYFDDTSTWDSTGTGNVSLLAPQTGTYDGIAIFGTRKGKLSTFKLTGGKDYFVDGTIYLPTVDLQLYGSVDLSVTSKSGYVIASKFYYQGDSSFTFDAFGGAVPSALGSVSANVRLIQ